MRSVRIQPAEAGTVLLIDIVCQCGNNGMKNVATGEFSFKHRIPRGIGDPVTLKCGTCEREYVVQPQGDHVHVSGAPAT